jgi:hypothetical protein
MDTLPIIRTALKSQYHAALEMLQAALERCPDSAWQDGKHTNDFWQIAYHALHYVHMYLQPDLASFKPWHGHQREVQYQAAFAGSAKQNSSLPLLPTPYSKAQVLELWAICNSMVDEYIDTTDLFSDKSGFPWYTCGKLEHAIISIRHLQHHTAQLSDRLREVDGAGLEWLGH